MQPEILPRRQATEQPPQLGVVARAQAGHRRVGKQRFAPPHQPRAVVRSPTIGEVKSDNQGEHRNEHQRGSSQPTLHQPYAAPEEVANQDHHRGPDGSTEGVVEDEGPPAHPANARDQCSEDAQAREEARKEYGLAPVPLEERFGASQPLGGYEDVASPPQDEGSAPLASDPIADLVPDDGPHDAEHDGIPKVQVSSLDQDAGGQEYGLTGQGHARALKHHPEEDDQVAVVFDEREDPVHSRKCSLLRRSGSLFTGVRGRGILGSSLIRTMRGVFYDGIMTTMERDSPLGFSLRALYAGRERGDSDGCPLRA